MARKNNAKQDLQQTGKRVRLKALLFLLKFFVKKHIRTFKAVTPSEDAPSAPQPDKARTKVSVAMHAAPAFLKFNLFINTSHYHDALSYGMGVKKVPFYIFSYKFSFSFAIIFPYSSSDRKVFPGFIWNVPPHSSPSLYLGQRCM